MKAAAVSSSTNVENDDTEAVLMQETAALLASLSDVILSPIKAPKMDTSQEPYEVYNESEVRLKLLLVYNVLYYCFPYLG